MAKSNERPFENMGNTQMGILKRSLHIIALLQDRSNSWNGRTLADTLSLDENEPISDKTVRAYINGFIRKQIGIKIDAVKGGRRLSIEREISDEELLLLTKIYSVFVFTNDSQDEVIRKFIKSSPDFCLWLPAVIHFAICERKKVEISYHSFTKGTDGIYKVNPYELIIRNHNLYLLARNQTGGLRTYLLAGITTLKVTDEFYRETPESAEKAYQHTLGSYRAEKPIKVKIRIRPPVYNSFHYVFSPLDPEYTVHDGFKIASLKITDTVNLFRQLFSYGANARLIGPPELVKKFKEMLLAALKAHE